ncbi:effector candidate [Paramuricea clavata]|uniref:Effector candidate, partial n=1 Tax=Paramuricea clavata TaxID=317549 RepID=A0A6S7G065_PARCT|nr:effector candidate [Paramuricea clavata]
MYSHYKELIIREDVPEEKLSVDHEQYHDAEDQVPLPTVPDIEDEENLPAVGETYEESFVKQVENLETKRQRKAPKKFSPDECNITESLTAENEEPQSISEALNGANASKWKQALAEEYNSLISNETWELVPPPEGCNVIGSKWQGHWNGVKRLLRYIKGTLNFGLKFTSENDDENGDELYGYSDANWAGDVDSGRSTSGYVFKVANSTVSWCSKKQASVTKSTTEAEYVALSEATKKQFG